MTEGQDLGQLRNQFTAYMHEGVNTLARLGYNATRFRQMLLNEGDGVIVARRLVMADGADGLWRPVLQDAFIKEAYDLIRAWCQAFAEQELLQNVTQPYRANIMMTRPRKIDSKRLDAAVAVIGPLFDRACDRMTGHSHAAE